MSTVLASPAAAAPPKPGLRHYVKDFWAVADQALIAGSNFTAGALLARGLGPSKFGIFTLVYAALLFANQLQIALVTQPHNVLGSSRHRGDYAAYTTSTLLSQLLLGGVEALAALVAALVAYQIGWSGAPLLLLLAPCVMGWQLMEFVRRVLYTEGRQLAAFVNDTICYGGQMVTIAVLWALDNLRGPAHGTPWLTGVSAMYALSITAFLAAFVGLWQIRRSLTRHFSLYAVPQNWQFGKWLAGSEILSWCSSIQIYFYLAAWLLGTVATGELRAAQLLFGPTRILAYYLDTVLPIRFARRIAAGADHTVSADLRRLLARVVLPMGTYCLVVALVARPLLNLTFGVGYAGAYVALVLYAVYTFLTYVQMIVATALKARRMTHLIFAGSVCGVVVAMPTSLVLIREFQINGVVAAMIAGAAAVTGLYLYAARHTTPEACPRDLALATLAVAGKEGAVPELMQPPAPVGQKAGRGAILFRVFDVLERVQVSWCALHGYQSWPSNISSDVDLLMPPRMLPRELARLLHDNREQIGAEVVLWLNDGAQFIVLCGRVPGEPPCVLQLHVSPDYSLAGRTFYKADEILNTRVRHDSFWVPAPHIEFGSVLVNRIIKQNLRPEHERRLSELASQHPADCEREVRRFFQPGDVRLILQASRGGDWSRVRRYSKELLRGLMRSRGAESAGGGAGAFFRRVRRWLKPPCGLHVVFLGPDGVGKSTVIEAVRADLSPIFLREKYLTFAPGLLPGRFEVPKPDGPHSLPPRSYPASLLKAAWWTFCYTIGYLLSVHSTLTRAGLVVNHRYLPDAIVDPKRYRYSGPQWILRALWRVAPKPHLLFLLDAPAEVIQARKKEVAPEETVRQREAYRAMAQPLPFARIIDNSRPLPEVVGEIERIILGFLSDRAAAQLKVGANR